MYSLGRNQRETRGQVEAHLITKYGFCAGAGTVTFLRTMITHMAHQVEILLQIHLPLPISVVGPMLPIKKAVGKSLFPCKIAG